MTVGRRTFRKPPFAIDRTRYGDLSVQIADGLRTAIQTGFYEPGDILPPVRDLAEILEVSKTMVERGVALVRQEGLISPRPHIGSVVCAKERPLWKGHIVIVVPPGIGNPFENLVYANLRDALTAAGFLATPVTVAPSKPGRYDNFALLDTVLRQQADLVMQIQGHENIARWLSKRGIPFVRLGVTDFRPPNCIGLVRRDNARAVPDFAAHCREAGIRSVTQIAVFRRADAAAALAKDGVAVRTFRVPKELEFGTGYELAEWSRDFFARTLGAKGKAWLPDLLFFNDDHLTTGALTVFHELGIRVPGDVRVVTWANKNYGPVFAKPLTRMEMDTAAIGEKLAECVQTYLSTGSFPAGLAIGPKYIRGETF